MLNVNENIHDEYIDDELETIDDLTQENENEIEYERKLSIVQFYKSLLVKEPEFIGISRLSSGRILNIIELEYLKYQNMVQRRNKNVNIIQQRLTTYVNIVTLDQINLFDNMFNDLKLNKNKYIYNLIIKKIFKTLYV